MTSQQQTTVKLFKTQDVLDFARLLRPGMHAQSGDIKKCFLPRFYCKILRNYTGIDKTKGATN